eukprot:3963653-Prymnesium_polylepis.2
MLNLPRPAILSLAPDSITFRRVEPETMDLLRCEPDDANYPIEVIKVYAVYNDAWWHTKLGLKAGTFYPKTGRDAPQLFIRYHDGPTHCHQGATDCSGALLVQYTGRQCAMSEFCRVPNSWRSEKALRAQSTQRVAEGGASRAFGCDAAAAFADISMKEHWGWWDTVIQLQNAAYLRDAPSDINEYIADTDSSLSRALHATLLSAHAAHFKSKGIDPTTVLPPSATVVGRFPRAYHAETRMINIPVQPSIDLACLKGASLPEYSAHVRKPIADRRLYVANNDFWIGDEFAYAGRSGYWWAETTLKQAERILHEHVGLPRPEWLDRRYHATQIAKITKSCLPGAGRGENDTSCWPRPKDWNINGVKL